MAVIQNDIKKEIVKKKTFTCIAGLLCNVKSNINNIIFFY